MVARRSVCMFVNLSIVYILLRGDRPKVTNESRVPNDKTSRDRPKQVLSIVVSVCRETRHLGPLQGDSNDNLFEWTLTSRRYRFARTQM